ncbi:t-SNARE [Bisporella sp. PMI_857]|nr:t-SNARE [Bisporella sp. PMI_857]
MSYAQYQQYGGNPYSQGPDVEAGYGGQHLGQNPGAPPLSHELSNYSQSSHYSNAAAPGFPSASTTLSQVDFLSRIDLAKADIRTLSSSISQIASLHERSIGSADNSSSAQLESLVTQTQLKNTQIRDHIKFLEGDAVKTPSTDTSKKIKTTQANNLKKEFEKALQDYRQEELAYQARYREQIARQYRIVNPQASEAEVREASELDWGSEGVFQAALKSNRSGQASSVLGAVRARHNELQRIEQTLTELAAIFADLAQIVESQDPVVEHTEQNAIQTAEDVDKANEQITKASRIARATRRKKWWCLLIVVLIILAIALGVGLGIGLTRQGTKTVTGN